MHVKKNVIKERQLLTEVVSPANSTHVLHDIDILNFKYAHDYHMYELRCLHHYGILWRVDSFLSRSFITFIDYHVTILGSVFGLINDEFSVYCL